MNRRDLLRLAGLSSLAIFAPRFGRWYRRGSGLVVSDGTMMVVDNIPAALQASYWLDVTDAAGRVTSYGPAYSVNGMISFEAVQIRSSGVAHVRSHGTVLHA